MSSATAIQSTWIEHVTYEWLIEKESPRVMVHEGGTRSGKTYNIAIAWAEYLVENPGELLSIVRLTGPALKATVQRDLEDVLQRMGYYDPARHNKTENIIELPGGSRIEMFSVDDYMKVHGRKREHLWCNEANELPWKTYQQLVFRTENRVVLDFNPSMEADHWIWKRYEKSPEAIWYSSTYLDNPFLTDETVREIEALKHTDPWAWQVYGFGERGVPAAAIYQDVEPLHEWPDGERGILGLDFGYNDPMVLERVARKDREPKPELLIWALLHESYLTTDDLIARLPDLGVEQRYDTIYCDGAEPDRIEMLKRAGYDARPADKSPGSRRAGIDYCKRHKLRIGGPAADRALREHRGYRWKEDVRTGRVLDEPVDRDDHAPDTTRYAAFTHYSRPEVDFTRVF